MNDSPRRPDFGMRGRRREPGSSVIRAATAPPPVSEGAFGDLQIVQSQYLADADPGPLAQGETHSAEDAARGSSQSLLRATGSMAIANLVSRITGFVRMSLILWTLGGAVASAFNTANQLPNMVTELVLGSVLTGMFMPLLSRASREDDDGGLGFVRRLITVTATGALLVTLIAVAAAPWLTDINLSDGKVNTSLATAFAFLLLPQIFFYAVFSVLLAVLNKNEVFRPGAWAPVWNNLIGIATLFAYVLFAKDIDPKAPVNILDPAILLLGIGTTLGVVVQAVVLLWPLHRLGINLRPQWGIDNRLKDFAPSALAGFTYVLISQVGLVVTNRIGSAADESAIAIYQSNWLLLQVPYGILGVTLLTAINPRLADNGTAGRNKEVVADISLGTRLSVAGLLPIIALMTAFGPVIASGLFAYQNFSPEEANILGNTMSASAFTLIPYAIVLLQQRVFYARESYWTPTIIITVVTAVRVACAYLAPHVATSSQDVVMLLALSNGLGFLAGAVMGYILLKRSLGPLSGGEVLKSSGWVLLASVIGCAVALAADWILHLHLLVGVIGSFGDIIRMAILTPIALVVIVAVLMRSNLPELAPLTNRISALFSRKRG